MEASLAFTIPCPSLFDAHSSNSTKVYASVYGLFPRAIRGSYSANKSIVKFEIADKGIIGRGSADVVAIVVTSDWSRSISI